MSEIAAADRYRETCSPECHFSHHPMIAGALGGTGRDRLGKHFGNCEAAIGTGQAIFHFAPPLWRGAAKGGGG